MTGPEPFTVFTPEALEDLKQKTPETIDVTIEVDGKKKVIGEATINVDDKGIHINPTLIDKDYAHLVSDKPKVFSVAVEPDEKSKKAKKPKK